MTNRGGDELRRELNKVNLHIRRVDLNTLLYRSLSDRYFSTNISSR